MRIWGDSDHTERHLMEFTARLFFEDMGQVLREYIIISACRITDPARSSGHENFTIETFAQAFSSDPQTFKQLQSLQQRMLTLRQKILLTALSHNQRLAALHRRTMAAVLIEDTSIT